MAYGRTVIAGLIALAVLAAGLLFAIERVTPAASEPLDPGYCAAVPWPVPPDDDDCDGFSNADEIAVGTDPFVPCADTPNASDEADDGWPPDFDDNQVINTTDVFQVLAPHFGTGVPPTDIRRDLFPDGVINTTDVFRVLPPFFGATCNIPGSSPTPTPSVGPTPTTPSGFPTDPDLVYFAGDNIADTAVSFDGQKIMINGGYTYPGRVWDGNVVEGLLLNSRMVNGVYDDMDGDPPSGMEPWDPRTNTEDYVANMGDWRDQGLLGIGINFQGGSNRCNNLFGDNQHSSVDNNPFGPNGSAAFDDWYSNTDTPHARYLARMGSIIREADDLGMAVILGFFYFGQDDGLDDEAAVYAAVDAATDWILDNGWTNVLIEINNESNINYDFSILQPDNVIQLIERVQTRSSGAAGAHLPHGHLLVSTSGGGGYHPPDEWIEASDYVLLHGNSLNASGITSLVTGITSEAIWQADPIPIIFNEDSTSMNNFERAVEEGASWGYYDSDGYQCVFPGDEPARWTLGSATESEYWPLLAEISGN